MTKRETWELIKREHPVLTKLILDAKRLNMTFELRYRRKDEQVAPARR